MVCLPSLTSLIHTTNDYTFTPLQGTGASPAPPPANSASWWPSPQSTTSPRTISSGPETSLSNLKGLLIASSPTSSTRNSRNGTSRISPSGPSNGPRRRSRSRACSPGRPRATSYGHYMQFTCPWASRLAGKVGPYSTNTSRDPTDRLLSCGAGSMRTQARRAPTAGLTSHELYVPSEIRNCEPQTLIR